MNKNPHTAFFKKISLSFLTLGLACSTLYTPFSYAAYPLGDEVIFYNFEDTGATTNNLGSSGDTNDGTFV